MAEEGAVPEQYNLSPVGYEGAERRRKLRIYRPFTAAVRGFNVARERFKISTNIDNISGGGLYLWLPQQQLAPGAELFIVVRFSSAPVQTAPAARVAIRGRVLRLEPQPIGICGVAVRITRHRFL